MSGEERFGVSTLSVPLSPDSSPLSASLRKRRTGFKFPTPRNHCSSTSTSPRYTLFYIFISGINDLFRSRRSLSDSYPSKEQQKLRYRAEHSLLLISDAFVFTHPQTQVVSPPLFSSHSHTLSRCRTFSFHLSG
ncbi:unnamed protein product [Brassica oleracea]